jgi:hypothetical protein
MNCFGCTRSFPTDRQFTGQRLDGTGLYYYGARGKGGRGLEPKMPYV